MKNQINSYIALHGFSGFIQKYRERFGVLPKRMKKKKTAVFNKIVQKMSGKSINYIHNLSLSIHPLLTSNCLPNYH